MDLQLLAAGRTGVFVLALMPASLTRSVTFRATHRYYRPDWTEAQNREVFGPLTEPPGHGHDYQCAVTVAGSINPSGMLVDLGLLDRILKEEVVWPVAANHQNQLRSAYATAQTLPTCEAIAAYLFPRIAARLPRDVVL